MDSETQSRNRLWTKLVLRLGNRAHVSSKMLHVLKRIKNSELYHLLYSGCLTVAVTALPILALWMLFSYLLQIQITWLRTILLWSLIFSLFILGGLPDEMRKQ